MSFDLPLPYKCIGSGPLRVFARSCWIYLDVLRISMDVLATGRVDESDERWCLAICSWLVVTSKFFLNAIACHVLVYYIFLNESYCLRTHAGRSEVIA